MSACEVFLIKTKGGERCEGCDWDAFFSRQRPHIRPEPLKAGEDALYYSHNYKIGEHGILCCRRCDPKRIKQEIAEEQP